MAVSLSQLFKSFQVGYLSSYFGPLGFVLITTIGKEGYEDYLRYKRDEEANSQICTLLTERGSISVPSSRLRVGDIISIEKNSKIPVDIS